MNNILRIKMPFKAGVKPRGGPLTLRSDIEVSAEKMRALAEDIRRVERYWSRYPKVTGALVSVYYREVVAKSNRIRELLTATGKDKKDFYQTFRGAKFLGSYPQIKHVITHYVSRAALARTRELLTQCADFLEQQCNGVWTEKDPKEISKKLRGSPVPKTVFIQTVKDAYFVERFAVDENLGTSPEGQRLVTLYRTDKKARESLSDIGVRPLASRFLDDQTVLLDAPDIEKIRQNAPYLFAMSMGNFVEWVDRYSGTPRPVRQVSIPAPRDEPVIGVIDTQCASDVYFHEWVQSQCCVAPELLGEKAYEHGTAVCSVIVDGPAGNPDLEDGCGRFCVRHFGVTGGGGFNTFTVLKTIRRIVSENQQIKVWNLSLGSKAETDVNTMSVAGSELDRLQSEFDIVFVVAGTNIPKDVPKKPMRIGEPADSVNSIVVNAVTRTAQPASYSREGPSLHFFTKPDICSYGGEKADGDFIRVCNDKGEALETGTSFAAPWIARKMAFLICRMGFTREEAKALLIDAAVGWQREGQTVDSKVMGFGVVPQHINDILKSRDDEIRFLVSGEVKSASSYVYGIPVPSEKKRYPFWARATLCYFPKCDRNQGVDYTGCELGIQFGPTADASKGPKIQSIDSNCQGDEGYQCLPEGVVRQQYRKWDNTKVVRDVLKARALGKTVKSDSDSWGISIRAADRLGGPEPGWQGMRFAVAVTLRELKGKNRMDDFVKRCQMKGWIVNEIDVEQRLAISLKAEEEVVFS